MKTLVPTLSLGAMLLATPLTSAGVVTGTTALFGGVSDPTDTDGNPLPGGRAVALVVDLNGDGISSTLDPFVIDSSGTSILNGDLVVGLWSSVVAFGQSVISFPGFIAEVGVTIKGSEPYYAMWFDTIDTGADQTDPGSITTTGGETYLYARNFDWIVPGAGGTATPTAATAPFGRGVIVPEPSGVLLLSLSALTFAFRRRTRAGS